MKDGTSQVLSFVDRLMNRTGPFSRVVDVVMDRIAPKATAQAGGCNGWIFLCDRYCVGGQYSNPNCTMTYGDATVCVYSQYSACAGGQCSYKLCTYPPSCPQTC
jgi:hypothetical protein